MTGATVCFLPQRLEESVITPFDRFVEAIERRGAELRPTASGFRAVGLPCPKCGADGHDPDKPLDRVRLFPFDDNHGRRRSRWFCNTCKSTGDDVSFMEACGMSFYDAYVAVMGEAPPDRPMSRNRNGSAMERCRERAKKTEAADSSPAREAREWRIRQNPWPCAEWMAKATALCCELDHCHGEVGERHVAEARRWIEEGRGIQLDVAPTLGIYWNPRDRYEDPKLWGLKRAKKLFVPKGVVIAQHRRTCPPWEAGPWIVGLLVRRAEPSGDADKLRWVPFRDDGAGPEMPKIRTMLLGMTTAKGCPCIVMESALDAALAFQESGAEAAVISTNGADYPLDEDCAEMLASASSAWAWPDADAAGMDAFRRWKKAFPSLKLIEMPKDAEGRPWAKDATGLVQERRRRPECPTVRSILESAGVVAHG